jgi:hypothetical protein
VIDFLAAVQPNQGFAELRAIRNGAVHQQFFEDRRELMAEALKLDAMGWDAYWGVLPRVRQSGKAEDCWPVTQTLWADVDSKHLDGTKLAALLALGRSTVPPSILVDSGNGLHAYWLLREPIAFGKASEAMKGLATAIGGDHTHDGPRVLRLPGTSNHKTDPPHPVRLLHFEPQRKHWFSDFADYLPDPVERVAITPRTTREYSSLPDWLRELIERPTPNGYRSGAIFKAMLWLIRYGWGYDDIHDLLLDFPEGFGEKVAGLREKDADRWIMRTFRRAEAAAAEEAV